MAITAQAQAELEACFVTLDCRTRNSQHICVIVRWNREGNPKMAGVVACRVDIYLKDRDGEEATILVLTEDGVAAPKLFIQELMRTYAISSADVIVVAKEKADQVGTYRSS